MIFERSELGRGEDGASTEVGKAWAQPYGNSTATITCKFSLSTNTVHGILVRKLFCISNRYLTSNRGS